MSTKNELKKETTLPDADNEASCVIEQIEDKDIKLHCTEKKRPQTETTSEEAEEAAGRLMDTLHLCMLQLIEAQISQQLTLETHTSRARLILARNRLLQGTQRTPVAPRLPGHTPYRALIRLLDQGLGQLRLLRFDVEPARGLLRPVTHIFGKLVPHCFRVASGQWERCVEQIVECTNVQRELENTLRSIERLKWTLDRRRHK